MTGRELLRHSLAVLAYRGGKAIRNAPPEFASFDTGGGHTPLVILAHLGDLLVWTLSHAKGEGKWPDHEPATWDEEAARFFEALAALDTHLASDAAVQAELTRLLQGPLADALTHVGQLMMLRRMRGAPVYGENYLVADIVTGRVGPEQSPPVKPF